MSRSVVFLVVFFCGEDEFGVGVLSVLSTSRKLRGRDFFSVKWDPSSFGGRNDVDNLM